MKTILYELFIMVVLNISTAYAGEWTSQHHSIHLKFNENIWRLVATQDDIEDTFVSVFDQADGASFLVRVEYLEDATSFEDSIVAQTLAEGLQHADPQLAVIARRRLEISGNTYSVVDYQFQNKKFGPQLVRHAFFKKTNFLVILSFSWPLDAAVDKKMYLPPKHLLLMDGLHITN